MYVDLIPYQLWIEMFLRIRSQIDLDSEQYIYCDALSPE